MRRYMMIVVPLVITVLWAASAPLAQSGKVSPKTKKRAKSLFRRGNRLVKKKDYGKAIASFKEAYELWKHPSILYNMASAFALKGDVLEAAKPLREFLKHRALPKDQLPEILQKVLNATGILVVEVPDSQASIHVDGRKVGEGKVRLTVLTGERVIDVRVGDRIVAHKRVKVPSDKEKVWELAQMPSPPRPRPRTDSRKDPEGKGELSGGMKKKKTKEKEKSGRGLGRLHWGYFTATSGLAVASLAGAITASFLTKEARDENHENPTPETKDTGEKRQLAANILWGVTAAVAAGASVVAIFTRWGNEERPEESSKEPKRLRATVFPGGASLSWSW